jgi:hypothetical protein
VRAALGWSSLSLDTEGHQDLLCCHGAVPGSSAAAYPIEARANRDLPFCHSERKVRPEGRFVEPLRLAVANEIPDEFSQAVAVAEQLREAGFAVQLEVGSAASP